MTTRSESSLQREKVTKILAKVASQGDKFTHSGSDEARQQLINSARELVYAAESPVESLLWHMWSLVSFKCAPRKWQSQLNGKYDSLLELWQHESQLT